MKKENSDKFLLDSRRELAGCSLAGPIGRHVRVHVSTCAYGRIYLEIQIAVGMRAVSFLLASANETTGRRKGKREEGGRERERGGTDVCHQSSALAIIIHSNDDGCLYPWAWCD